MFKFLDGVWVRISPAFKGLSIFTTKISPDLAPGCSNKTETTCAGVAAQEPKSPTLEEQLAVAQESTGQARKKFLLTQNQVQEVLQEFRGDAYILNAKLNVEKSLMDQINAQRQAAHSDIGRQWVMRQTGLDTAKETVKFIFTPIITEVPAAFVATGSVSFYELWKYGNRDQINKAAERLVADFLCMPEKPNGMVLLSVTPDPETNDLPIITISVPAGTKLPKWKVYSNPETKIPEIRIEPGKPASYTAVDTFEDITTHMK